MGLEFYDAGGWEFGMNEAVIVFNEALIEDGVTYREKTDVNKVISELKSALKLQELVKYRLELCKRNPQGKQYVDFITSELQSLIEESEK